MPVQVERGGGGQLIVIGLLDKLRGSGVGESNSEVGLGMPSRGRHEVPLGPPPGGPDLFAPQDFFMSCLACIVAHNE